MSLTTLNLTAALFAATAYASNMLARDSNLLFRPDDVLNRPYAEVVHLDELSRRQENNGTADDLNPDAGLSWEEWDQITNEACVKALGALPQSTNPSGICVCYNLPSLNKQTGDFEADLRMYRVSEPRGEFLGVAPENIRSEVFYTGTEVGRSDELEITGMVGGQVSSILKRQSGPQPLKVFTLTGQINRDAWDPDLSLARLEQLVLPVFTITATSISGAQVQTNVSTNEASFLTGVFSNEVIMNDFAKGQLNVTQQREMLRNGEVAFVLPGVQILIFPVGLIITSSWLLIGLAVYGFGTYERITYAHMYRQRKAVTSKGATRTI